MDIASIKEQFKKIITYSQGIPEPQIDSLFERWAQAKERFIEMFDGELIYEIPFELNFELEEQSKDIKFYDFLEKIEKTYRNIDLSEFLDRNKNGFFNNQVVQSVDPLIPVGMKLIKAMKYFEGNENTLRRIQDEASHIVQQKMISGKLCFSIHPLDFLSLSENDYNWHSCHSLDGDFRSGNLSYMLDECTVICYLKGNDEVELPNFPKDIKWNSKKWRVLFYVSTDENMVMASRQYPFSIQKAMDKALFEFKKLCYVNYNYCSWDDTYITFYKDKFNDYRCLRQPYLPYNDELIKFSDIVKIDKLSCQFNDIIDSSYYERPMYSINKMYGRYSDTLPQIKIGAGVECLQCGQVFIAKGEATMRCPECEVIYGTEINDIYGNCDCCGRRMILDDCHNVSTYDSVCQYCFENACFVCPDCGEICYNEEKCYDEKYEDYVCIRCYNERREQEQEEE